MATVPEAEQLGNLVLIPDNDIVLFSADFSAAFGSTHPPTVGSFFGDKMAET
jgi:hypothetical protein